MRADPGAAAIPCPDHHQFPGLEDHVGALLQLMTEAVAAIELISDQDGRPVDYVILDANPAFRALTATGAREVAGARASAAFGMAPPPGVAEYGQVIAAGTAATFVTTLDPGHRLFRISAFPTGPQQCVTIAEDITEHRRLEQRLGHAQRMETIGQLAGGVAHDFNNLLTAILGYSELLLTTFDPGDPRRQDVEEIRKAGESAAALNRQLLAYSRRELMSADLVDVNEIVAEIEKMLGRILGSRIALVTDLAPGLQAVRAEPGQIQQIVLNLAVNARDAMPGGGTLSIRTEAVQLTPQVPSPRGLSPGSYVALTIRDTGVGIDMALQPHIFEPFFTTKENGTGLGLATVAGIAQQAGGEIDVASVPGQGTSFTVYLPGVDLPAERRSRVTRPAPPGGKETILVVEDQIMVRELARKILEQNGYVVLEAPDTETAVSVSRQHPGAMDLVFTDFQLPGMNARELMNRLRQDRPGLKVLYTSGYTDTEETVDPSGAGLSFLQKPFTPADLLWRVRHALRVPGHGPGEAV